MTEPRVLIVEDEVIVAEALRRSLEARGYAVIGHAIDAREALHMARRLHPDVVLMDIVLGGRTNGIEAARSIQRVIDTSIIFVTGQSDEALVSAAARSGAAGYVVKPFQALQVTSSIKIALHRRNAMRARERPRATPTNAARETRRVAIGRWHREDGQLARGGHESPFTSMVQRLRALLTDEEVWSSDQAAATRALPSGLCITQREREVILGLICYRRLTRVAEVLGISVHTVRNHLKSVFRKLNLHSQDELLEFLLNENQP